jgi:predicted AAA+ superfamily ATPase
MNMESSKTNVSRTLAAKLKEVAGRYPIVTVTGPRQSGKTTLVRDCFPTHAYVSLELPDQRTLALEDPRRFLARFPGPVILDEVQLAPELFSYLQVLVDEGAEPGRFILTGSQNFLLLERISQSLAGRCAVLHLLPFSLAELRDGAPLALEALGRGIPPVASPPGTLEETLFRGFYPPIHDRGLPPGEWLGNYTLTYLERDVRNLLQVGDLETFGRFLRLCAGRSGQLLNLSALASDAGISHTTARRWLSVLEASFLVALLRPHPRNFRKHLVRSPKLYFLDTGLLCWLLGIREAVDLGHHAMRGAIFESLVQAELRKNFLHRGEQAGLFFWRDSAGHEVDFVAETPKGPVPVEAKSGLTLASDAFGGLDYWRRLAGDPEGPAALVYGGEEAFERKGVVATPWAVL